MIRVIFIIVIVGCIAFMSPTRESEQLATQAGATLGGLGGLGAIASSPAGRRILDDALRGEIAARIASAGRNAADAAGPPAPVRGPR